ncbi:F-box only protein 7 [Electrophorus electricus]|uniref:F-box domain-containing protein n=1 Tax=Electrophorus electricus TaxID=8005 RepID=A0A4W4DVY5_ELEEL|nr:F-box only protein 7 [Electrophorus electricus]XP_026859828.2 F-box only protein 7 [Electrophorus electricus]XP_026859829.2 F-box only protein 7 [Electrophorus electricus]
MKLRVRVNKQTSRVELEGADPTLTELSVWVSEVVLPSTGLSADTEFSLSLNGKEPLVDTGQTLSSCGVVSGDMICVILPQSSHTSPNTQSTQQSHTPSAKHSSSGEAGPSSSSSSSSSKYTGDPEPEDGMATVEDEEGPAAPFIPEPMLCCEAEEGKVPHSLAMLFQAAQCHCASDCLLVAGHLLLLETGFLPQDCDVRAGKMPTGWRAAGGVYRLQYTHPLCENSVALVVAVPMGQTVVLNATLKMSSTVESARKLVLKPAAYVTDEWPGGNGEAVYRDLQKLSRVFKDQLAYPLIATAREALGLPALFGLAALPPELLLRILRLLDVCSLLSLSAVCTHLHSATHDPSLWRHILHRDFRVCIRADTEHKDTDWKELYKKRYRHRKEVSRSRVRCYPYTLGPVYPFSPIPMAPAPLYPPGIIGGEYDERLIPQGILPRPRYDPIGPLPGHEPSVGIPIGRRSLRPGGSRPADIRRGFI